MTANEFIQQILRCTSLRHLEQLLTQWHLVRGTPQEREAARTTWCNKWDLLSARTGLLLAGQMN